MNENLANNTELEYNSFEEVVLNLLFSKEPFKKRMVRRNQRVFMNKEMNKAIMARFRLRNKFLQEKIVFRKEI